MIDRSIELLSCLVVFQVFSISWYFLIKDRQIELAIKQNEERMEIIDQGYIMLVVPSSEKTTIEMNDGLALPSQSSVDNEASVTFDDVLTDLPMSSSKLLDVPMIGFPKNESSSASLDGMPKNDSSLLLLSENQSKRKRYVSAGGKWGPHDVFYRF